MFLRCLCCVLTLAAPLPALADRLSFEGSVSLGLTNKPEPRGVGLVDATLGVDLLQGQPLRFELGTYMVVLPGKRPHETYAAFAWDDRFRLGVVRPAYDSVLPSVFETRAPYLAYDRLEYARSHATAEAMRRTAVPFGGSARFEQGATQWMVSAHRDDKGGFDALSLAVSHEGFGWQVAAAVEGLRNHADDRDAVNAKLGGQADLGQSVTLGLAWLSPEGNDRPDALSADLVWQAAPQLNLAAFGAFAREGEDDAWGLSAQYQLRPQTGVSLAGTDSTDHGRALHLTLTQQF